jgi:DNA-binding CsgD family transcriptional regulator
MSTSFSLPWFRIHDFLVEIGSLRNKTEFGHRVLPCLADLIPFDHNAVLGINDSNGRIFVSTAIVDSSKWVDLHNNYYWKTMPEIKAMQTMLFDWRQLQHTEYGADFINPQGIGSSLVMPLFDGERHILGAIALQRLKGTGGFTEQDLLIMQTVQPHLSNFYAMHAIVSAYDGQLPDAVALAGNYKVLTRREAEIAALICRRFSTKMIAAQLMISPATVYRHIANIFAKFKVFNREELVEKLLN